VLSVMKTIWRRWKALAHGLVKVQSWLLMAIVYVVAMGPISVFIKLDKTRRLDRGPAQPDAQTFAQPVRTRPQDVRTAQRPW